MCTDRGSNQGPLGPKSDALTTAPFRHLKGDVNNSTTLLNKCQDVVNILTTLLKCQGDVNISTTLLNKCQGDVNIPTTLLNKCQGYVKQLSNHNAVTLMELLMH